MDGEIERYGGESGEWLDQFHAGSRKLQTTEPAYTCLSSTQPNSLIAQSNSLILDPPQLQASSQSTQVESIFRVGNFLGIPDALEARGGPATLSDLSSALGCLPSALHRIMRFLVFRNILKEGPAGYLQTPLSRLLMKNNDKSLLAYLWKF
ncbi:hypothetical protein RHSIM_RhsimUnG0199000 [Rhododendron simsii]|uniref:O-methyltransferase dimerisation domain-containing protein n=1 Tax=Rhododendron simsii TaxID=118357 RepID=A0A834FU36_RHOSS|nr:hypothetical protein RHSIM_RhsimUnG0199000 [Rhododendron simsii]